MLDTTTVRSRLAKLESYLSLLAELEGADEEEFAADPRHRRLFAEAVPRLLEQGPGDRSTNGHRES